MPPLEAAALVMVLSLPWVWLVQREVAKLRDPAYLRAHGVVLVSQRILQGCAEPIGEYLGHPIWASVRFMGMEYRFHRVQDRRKRERLAPGELFLEPGLVYLAS